MKSALHASGDGTRVLFAGGSYTPADASAMGHALLSLASFAASPPQPANLPAWQATMAPALAVLKMVVAALPSVVVGDARGILLELYDLGARTDGGLVRLCRYFRGDDDVEHLHSYPWSDSVGFMLLGSMRVERRYGDHVHGYEVRATEHHAGDSYAATGGAYERCDLITPEVWTLLVTGPMVNQYAHWSRTTGRYTPWRAFSEARGQRPHAATETLHDSALRCRELADTLSPDDPEALRLRAHADALLRGATP